ncbi:MAG: hypothetical protein RBG13Loki_0999 [Promethearchaeota archaeon CR_4]|nr:MAG: hypothetical protein RBG13Loki_0999 [Candidatus Lokiarchaeota archaeon CR_4]
MLPLAAHEDPIPRNKHVVKDDQRLRQCPHRNIWMKFMLGPISSSTTTNEGYPLGVGRNSEADGVVCLILTHLTGRNDHNLVCHGCVGDMCFRAFDNNAILILFYDMEIVVRVMLVGGLFRAIPFYAGDSATGKKVVLPQMFEKTGSIELVLRFAHLSGNDKSCIEAVRPDITSEG